jgi:hypothetical protein
MGYTIFLLRQSCYILTIYAPQIYTAPSVMFLMRAEGTRASGMGLGPGNREFFGPCEMASSQLMSAIRGPKNSRFPGLNRIPLAQVMDLPASKSLRTGTYNRCSY